ncbi:MULTISPECIES: LysR family transcriptional regulator [Glaesserella]|uniref:LysR family transcriptional regulator n=1 Tax=Glaesserella australis TaxID=2094024 RepID=A0A328C1M7_9PAST|nr:MULTISPECIES: LysR family transcriptional regulator [Glaesserella]AUI65484.1 LysR family transcriptional regulator [Glaesserella sp. 15-184]RAL19681.1 LysR family transcriptional regulator [Glaesserella australis]
MDKLNAINLFCKVIETQSFTQAAQQEQISLAMASKLVAQLEEHLNVRLLQRTTRRISPTEAGLLFYQRCLPILNELKEAEDCVTNVTSSLHGKLTMSLPMDFGSRFIAPHLSQFTETYPHLQLNLEFNDRRVDVVSEGYDLVLRIGKLEDSSIVAKRIAQAHHLVVASPDYLAKFGTPQTALELQEHQCLLYETQHFWQFNENGHQIKFKPQGQVYSNNGYALVQMAKAGQGIINIPKFLIKDELATQELIPILHHVEQEPLDISLLYPNRRYLSPKVKVAIEFFTQLMKEQKDFL